MSRAAAAPSLSPYTATAMAASPCVGTGVDEVDAHLETLREELAERERVLSDLRSHPSREPMPPEASTAPSTAVPPAVSPNRSEGG